MMSEPFDRQELLEELDGDSEFLQESLEILSADAPPLLKEIRDSIASGDGEAVRRSAHTLKSMVGNFCAQPAFDAAQKMERMGAGGSLKDGEEAFESLADEVERLQDSLRQFLEGLA